MLEAAPEKVDAAGMIIGACCLEPVRVDEHAVRDDGLEEGLDVVGLDERPAVEQRPRARRLLERERPAHGGADADDVEIARGADELDQPRWMIGSM